MDLVEYTLCSDSDCGASESSDTEQEEPLELKGYHDDGMLKFYNRLSDGDKSVRVDCDKAIPVFVEVNPHELKSVDDKQEQFGVLFVLKLYWVDPCLKEVKTKFRTKAQSFGSDTREATIDRLEEDTFTFSPGANGAQTQNIHRKDLLWIEHEDTIDKTRQFFPNFTFLNLCHTQEHSNSPLKIFERYRLLWTDKDLGSFVCWEIKYDAVFSHNLHLQKYPIDRQLCRIAIILEHPVEEAQFVLLKSSQKGCSNVCEKFEIDHGEEKLVVEDDQQWRKRVPDFMKGKSLNDVQIRGKDGKVVQDVLAQSRDVPAPENYPLTLTTQALQKLCTTYVRWADAELPFYTQRSRIHVLFHLERRGDQFFNDVVFNMFLVSCFAFSAFVVPLDDSSGSLGLIGACFLAVLAQRYIVNDELPRKHYRTLADWYLNINCLLLCFISIVIVYLAASRQRKDDKQEEAEDFFDWLEKRRFRFGWGIVILVLGFNLWLILSWWRGWGREDWASVYQKSKEPYALVEKCSGCGREWLGRQCMKVMRCQVCKESTEVLQEFWTPQDFKEPLVKPQEKPTLLNWKKGVQGSDRPVEGAGR